MIEVGKGFALVMYMVILITLYTPIITVLLLSLLEIFQSDNKLTNALKYVGVFTLVGILTLTILKYSGNLITYLLYPYLAVVTTFTIVRVIKNKMNKRASNN